MRFLRGARALNAFSTRWPSSLTNALSWEGIAWRDEPPDKVAGIEGRGFILGAPVAVTLGAGFVACRKEGSLFPGPKLERETEPDYRGNKHRFRLRRNSVGPGDRVLLVDDWCETGNQARAAKGMIEECGGYLIGVSVIVDQLRPASALDVLRYTFLIGAGELSQA
jgi:adenine phosphoribosyltransferase